MMWDWEQEPGQGSLGLGWGNCGLPFCRPESQVHLSDEGIGLCSP